MGNLRGIGVTAVLIALLGAVFAAPAQVAASSSSSAPIPVVSGNAILDDRTQKPWQSHSVNWPSFEYACEQGWAYSGSGSTTAAAAAMAGWGINTVRLPLNESCWLGVDGSPHFGTAAGYRTAVRAWVDKLNAAGIVVILDLHWSAPPGYAADGQRAMADARSVSFWSQVASAYSAVPSVMFDLFNEPYSRWSDATNSWAFTLTWACWRDGGCQAPVENDTDDLGGATYAVAGMAQLVAAVRQAGATQPVLLGGLDYSNDLRQWLAYRPSDTQLIASWHNYPGQRCHTENCWNSEIGAVAAVVPVIATEFGQTDGGNAFLSQFMSWADDNGVGYSPWAWWVVSTSESLEAGRYALIADGAFTPKAPSGTAFHDHLAALTALGPFVDVTPGQPFFSDISWMWSANLSVGYRNGGGRPSYGPTDPVSRQAMASFLYRLSGATFSPPAVASFADVPTSSPFYTAIEWMKSTGLSVGYTASDGSTFHPLEPVTRQAMAAFLFRFSGQAYEPPTASSFTDVAPGSQFATAIEWMRSTGISIGYQDPGGPAFHPADPVTRQAMAAFLHRYSGVVSP